MVNLDTDIKADKVAITELEHAILLQESDICHYSQENLVQEHQNSDLVAATVEMKESLLLKESNVKEKESALEQQKLELKRNRKLGRLQEVELNGLQMKLKNIRGSISAMACSGNEKKQLLKDLDKGVAEAIGNDHKSQKAKVCSLSEQFLQATSKKSGSGNTSLTNGEKLKALDEKISTMKATLARRKKTHSQELKRLKNEHAMLEKVSLPGRISH